MVEFQGRKIWQQGSGDGDRKYFDICLNWDVILNGPGNCGAYPECAEILKKNGWSAKKITDIKRFAVDMQEGDLVVLRGGTNLVYGIGIIVGDYFWSDLFSDIDGWDLQHVRRVQWLWSYQMDLDHEPKKFDSYTLKLGDTTQPFDSNDVFTWIQSLNLDLIQVPSVRALPTEQVNLINNEAISDFLFSKGTSSSSIEHLRRTIDDLRTIAKWYKSETDPSEFETETHLIVPLLRALGWTPQKMALEWKNVDIALFRKLPRSNDDLIAVFEAKRKGTSCLKAYSQAYDYAKPLNNCSRLIVSDGLRYGVFIKSDQPDSSFKLHAYMNLTEFKSEYPILECHGILEALWSMTPEWNA